MSDIEWKNLTHLSLFNGFWSEAKINGDILRGKKLKHLECNFTAFQEIHNQIGICTLGLETLKISNIYWSPMLPGISAVNYPKLRKLSIIADDWAQVME